MRAGRMREALPLAARAVTGARNCLPGHALLASILLQLGRAPAAEEVIARAAELEPGGADAYDGLAFVSLRLDRGLPQRRPALARSHGLVHRRGEPRDALKRRRQT